MMFGLSLAVASLVIFVMIELVPGDPAAFMLGINAAPDTLAALRAELGLDANPAVRYVRWVSGMLIGDFGVSYTYQVPVAELVSARLVVSLPLAVMALLLSILIAIPAGMFAAARRGQAADVGIMGVTQLGIAIPNFWFAMLLVMVFAIHLRWVSAGGFPGWEAGVIEGVKALLLPAIALAVQQASILARVVRSALLDTLTQDYIRTARARGLSRRQVLVRHAFRNAMIPVLTILGLQFSFLIAAQLSLKTYFFFPALAVWCFRGLLSAI